jgi:hypothetical protein
MYYKQDILAVVCLLFICVAIYFLELSIKEICGVGGLLLGFIYLCWLVSALWKQLQLEIIKAKDEILDELKKKNKE